MDERNELLQLPKGWVWTRLEDFCEIILGQSPPSSTYNGDGKGIPFYQGKAEFGKVFPTPQKWCTAPTKFANKGDVLISVRAPVGPTNICPEYSAIGRGLAAIRGLAGIEPLSILYLVRAFENKIAEQGTGSTFSAISGNQLKNFQLPLAPLPEQHRIVAKIEELFSDLDAGVAALQKTKAELKRYRQAVLKAAVEGKLTAEWRAANAGKVESAEKLLERIRVQRVKRAKGKYKEFPPFETSGLAELPNNWQWTRLQDLCYLITDGTHLRPEYFESGVPFLSVKNVRPGKILDNDVKKISAEQHAEYVKRCKPEKGDILYTKVGVTYGFAAINTLDYEFSIYVSLALLKYPQEHLYPKFFEYCMNSQVIYSQAQKRIKGIGRPDLHLEEIREFRFPLPPLTEQQQIVAEVERRLSVAEQVERTVDASLKQAERLRQSILRQAFAGKLVPQDPGDESAEKLLERIRENRAMVGAIHESPLRARRRELSQRASQRTSRKRKR